MRWSEAILAFYDALPCRWSPPNGVEVIFPFDDPEVRRVMRLFFTKYYDDENPRTLLLGINPGRFGAGVTGIGFTDPVLLETVCGIPNTLPRSHELSAEFICEVVEAYGGAKRFYGDFFVTTVLPFGLLRNGKNYNYYDDKATYDYFLPFIVDALTQQMRLPHARRRVGVIGKGKNVKVLTSLNAAYGWFDAMEVLPHPRWVMQYRRKEKSRFIELYLTTLEQLQ